MKTIETGPLIDDLAISENALAGIILRAKSFGAIVPESDPRESSNGSDDRMIDALEDQPDNPARMSLEKTINNLSDEQRNTLVALTWVGRGDYSAVEWADALSTAQARDGTVTSHYLSEMPLLADHLENGAAELGINVTDAKAAIMSHDQNPDPMRAVK
ncbi:MAG: hypothetical protein CMK03_03865 [Ponticaulis sp.]|nr:hypothetical protein [Ponticaulis sp.]